MPSTAIEPFSTTKRRRAAGRPISSSRPEATPVIFLTVALASTWPCTRWPSSRPSAPSGSSRFTSDPTTAKPRFVRRSVSGTWSAKKAAPCFLTTVRQQPLTATLEPIFSRRAADGAAISSRFGPVATTVPTELTIPVNIGVGGDQHVFTQACEIDVAQGNRIHEAVDPRSSDRTRRLAAPDHSRGDVGVHLVDEVVGEERRVDLATSLHQDAQQV